MRIFRIRSAGRTLTTAAAAIALLAGAARSAWALNQAVSPSPTQSDPPAQSAALPPGVKLVAQMPGAAPAWPFHFPPFETETLASGARVFVVPDRSEPFVTLAVVLPRAGAIADPPGLAGLARMTAQLLIAGTATRTGQQIAQVMDLIGGTISASASEDDTTVVVRVAEKDFDLGMRLLADVALHPAFPADQIELERQRALGTLRVDYSDPGYIATAAFSRIAYGESPYGLPAEGTPQTITRISRDDITAFQQTHYGPNGALVGLAGDVTPEEAFAAAAKYFSAWPPAKDVAAAPAAPAASPGLKIYEIDQPGAGHTQIRLGRATVARSDPDYFPLLVAERIFGGGYDSLLDTAVRASHGLTDGASSDFVAQHYAGEFVAAAEAGSDRTVAAAQLLVDQIGKMGSGQFTASDLDFSIEYLTGAYAVQTETTDQALTRVLTAAEYGLGADDSQTYPQRVAAVTLDEAQRAAHRYFDPKDLDLVIVGDAASFRDALKKAFPTAAYEEISLAQLDLLEPKLHRVAPVIPAPTPEALAQGHAALDAAARTAGGSAIAAVKSIRVVESSQVLSAQGAVTFDETYLIAYPDRLHSDLTIMGQQLEQVYDGQNGWMASAQAVEPLPANLLENVRRRILTAEGIGIYQAELGGAAQAQWLGEEQVEGRKLSALEWRSGTIPIKLYIDPTTHMIAGAGYIVASNGGSVETDEIWGDFRSVAGLELPFHIVAYQNGTKVMDVTIKDVQVNVAVDPKSFAKPQPVAAPASPVPSAAPAAKPHP